MKLLIFLVLLCFSGVSAAESFTGRVVRVLDGDTLDVIDSSLANARSGSPVRVRLLNIDAPERKQAYGRWSAQQLKDLLNTDTVSIEFVSKDRYGRVLGRVYSNGNEINRAMVEAGAAWVYEFYNSDKDLPGIQEQARKERRGLWGDIDPIAPWVWRHSQRTQANIP